jgi:hypothetical protein
MRSVSLDLILKLLRKMSVAYVMKYKWLALLTYPGHFARNGFPLLLCLFVKDSDEYRRNISIVLVMCSMEEGTKQR